MEGNPETMVTRSEKDGNSGLLWILLLWVVFVPGPVSAAADKTTDWSSRLVDLQKDIPQILAHEKVPGVSIALIANQQIVASQGFGVSNRYFPHDVTRDTVFEAASVSKAVASYAALALAGKGVLDLDQDISSYLQTPWLQNDDQDVVISLRQILSHSSGLTNQVRTGNRDLDFNPGEHFQYSGMGFLYLQEVLEQQLNQPINTLMTAVVFKPLAMTHASFVPDFGPTDSVAWGHMPVSLVLPLILVPVSFLLALLTYLTGRTKTRLGITRVSFIALFLLAGIGLSMIGVNETGIELFAALSATLTALTVLGWCAFWLGSLMLRRLSAPEKIHKPALFLWALCILTIIYYSAPSIQAPVPGAPVRDGSLAWSLHCTAEDLAKFTLAVLNAETDSYIDQMTQAQIQAPPDNQWGLGLGLGSGSHGDYFYHTGDNPGFKALILGFPETGEGLVVMANGNEGARVADQIARQLFGETAFQPFLP